MSIKVQQKTEIVPKKTSHIHFVNSSTLKISDLILINKNCVKPNNADFNMFTQTCTGQKKAANANLKENELDIFLSQISKRMNLEIQKTT